MRLFLPTCLFALLATAPLAAQIALPRVHVPQVGGPVGGVVDSLDGALEGLDESLRGEAGRLLNLRQRTLDRLFRQNRDVIERDARGDLARRGELLVLGVTAEDRAAIDDAGFRILSTETIEGVELQVSRLAIPTDMSLPEAEKLAVDLGIGTEVSADSLHFQSGSVEPGLPLPLSSALAPIALQGPAIGTAVGVIDSAPGGGVATMATKGFAAGAPKPANHGSAIASLLLGAGVSRLRVADVYGADPAGGSALAIAKALGWLVASGSKVVTISLVGPRNAVVEKAVAAAREKGALIVAAVGNDGPAAPPAYPASYPGVIAVTGVDGRGRALIEAGRALNLDYAAPGADVYALDARGKRMKWRGTSFAAPLAAARLAAALQGPGNWRSRLDAEAKDLGKKGPDATYGRGLLCGTCARK